MHSDIDCLIKAAELLRHPAREDQFPERDFDPDAPYLRLTHLAKVVGLRTDYRPVPNSLTHGQVVIAYLDGRFVIVQQIEHGTVRFEDAEMSVREFRQNTHDVIVLQRQHKLATVLGRTAIRPWLMETIEKYRWRMAEAAFYAVLAQAITLVTPIILQVVIDKIVVYRATNTLVMLIAGYAAASAFEAFFSYYRGRLMVYTVNRIDVELLARLFDHLIRLPMSYFGSRDVGSISARLRELENIRTTLTGSTITAVIEAVFSCLFVALMLYYSWVLCAIHFAAIPLYVLSSVIFTSISKKRLREKFLRSAETQAFLVETLAGIETVKAAAIEQQVTDRHGDRVAALAYCSESAGEITTLSVQISTIINKVSLLVIFYVGAAMAIAGDLSVGQFIAFNMFSNRLSQPILKLIQVWQELQTAKTTTERLADIILTTPEYDTNELRSHPTTCAGRIEFQNVSFRYGRATPYVLKNIKLTIPPGQIVGIIGPSGSGKSTLASLLLRFYTAEGRVMLDGENIATMDPMWLRRQIGFVPQDTFLFNRSVRDNIALSNPGMPLDRVIDAAKLAEAHGFVINMPKWYDTIVGERGHLLSGGERQRLGIARAIAKDPKIMILDESTSALDFQTESRIQNNLRGFAKGRTVLIISHRYVTISAVDRIITLQEGRITEDGSPEQLLKQNGWYARLYHHQHPHASPETKPQIAAI